MAMERFELRIDEDQLRRVDAWAAQQPDRPARAEAFRRLAELGLGTRAKKSVEFTDGEKAIIWMLHDTMKHLRVDADIDHTLIANSIAGGHYWAPRWDMQGVFHDHADNTADVDYVVDVLEMWSFIEEALEKLTPDEIDEIEKIDRRMMFSGFDGNNESELFSIARFLINDMHRFSRFEKRDLNSHCATTARYRAMFQIFARIRPTLIGHGLNKDQLIEVFQADR